jgi:hypothetical protein
MNIVYLKDFADLIKTINSIRLNLDCNVVYGSSCGDLINDDLLEFDILLPISFDPDDIAFYCFDYIEKDKIYILLIRKDLILDDFVEYLNGISKNSKFKPKSSIKHNKVGFL